MRKWIIAATAGITVLILARFIYVDQYATSKAESQPVKLYVDGTLVPEQAGQSDAALRYEGSVYVKLAAISKQLNKQVGWDEHGQVAWIGAAPKLEPGSSSTAATPTGGQTVASSTPSAKATPPTPSKPAVQTDSLSLFGIGIGTSGQQVQQLLGVPARREPSPLGYEWWVYNKNLSSYLQVGIKDGKVVDLYSNAPLAKLGNVSIGTTYASLTGKHTLSPVVSFTYQGASIRITNQTKQRPLVMVDNTPVLFYLDTQNSQKVTAIRLMDRLVLLQGGFYETKWSYQGTAPQFDPPPLTIKLRELVDASHERQLLDLVNVIRYRYKLPQLTWYDPAAKVAKSHSQDMENAGYFDHVSATTGLNPFQRLQKGGVHFTMAGENIAAGFTDAIEAHENWMNSPGHRKNVLEKGFQQLGTGVYADYYTENFITRGPF